jgi:hypothetical protein
VQVRELSSESIGTARAFAPRMRTLLALLVLSGCEPVGSSSSVDAGSAQKSCVDLMRAYCMRLAACSPEASDGSLDECTAQAATYTNCASPQSLCVTHPSWRYGPSRAERCAADYAGLSCSDFIAGLVPPSCQLLCAPD